MNILKPGCVLFVLSAICSPALLYAPQALAIRPEDSLVVVTSGTPMGNRAGNAFVIGDGTLVVTAHHLVFEESEQGEHQMPGLVRLFSPYLGDDCEGEIVAADKELDLAVLKAPWRSHPALQLADDDSILSAECMQIIGMPEVIRGIGANANVPFPESLTFQREELPGDFVAVRQQTSRFISLRGIGQLGEGWSGSPMLLPGSSKAAGCFVRLHGTKGQRFVSAQGPIISQVKRLVVDAGKKESLRGADAVLPRAKDGVDVFLLTLCAYRDYLRDNYDSAFEKVQKLILVRPESAFAYGLSASVAQEQGKSDQAGQYYQKALKVKPDAVILKIYYAQFLSKHQPEKALEILQQIWPFDRFKPYVATLMFNVLSERGEFGHCAEFLVEALKVDANNAYLWVNLGACQLQSGDADNAVVSMTKAVELLPEGGPFRGQLAQLLEKQGRLDDAERHFRKLLEIEPDNPVVHFWLAQFLAKHRPAAKEEALKEAHVALELPVRKSLSRQVIEELISSLRSDSEQKPPE
jgi:tetratricopeptide (TPR) repeat protein